MEENIKEEKNTEEAGSPSDTVKSGKGKSGMTPKKKSMLLIVIALVVGIAIGAGLMFCICSTSMKSGSGEENSVNDSDAVYNGSIFNLAEGELDNGIEWEINIFQRELIFYGSGSIPDFTENAPAPWDKYASDIKEILLKPGITSVGTNAFVNCTKVTEIEIYATSFSFSDSSFPKDTAITFTVKNETIRDMLVSNGFDSAKITVIPLTLLNASGNTLSAAELGKPVTFTVNGKNYYAYNDFIDCTSGSNWQNALDFINALNSYNGGKGYQGHTDWQLLSSDDMARAWVGTFYDNYECTKNDVKVFWWSTRYAYSSTINTTNFSGNHCGTWGVSPDRQDSNFGFVVIRTAD